MTDNTLEERHLIQTNVITILAHNNTQIMIYVYIFVYIYSDKTLRDNYRGSHVKSLMVISFTLQKRFIHKNWTEGKTKRDTIIERLVSDIQ